MKNEESRLQAICVKWFRLAHKDKLIYAIPNGGKRGVVTASILKAEGLIAGCPDLHIPIPRGKYASLYIEMKTTKGVVQPHQKAIMYQLAIFGNKVVVCRSVDEFIKEVTEYFTA